MKPAIKLKMPRITIIEIVRKASAFEYFLSIKVVRSPEMTISGTFPSIITPSKGLTGFRKFSRFSFASIFKTRKNSAARAVRFMFSRTAR